MLLQTSVQWAAKHGTVRVLSKLLQACQALELDTAAGCGTLASRRQQANEYTTAAGPRTLALRAAGT